MVIALKKWFVFTSLFLYFGTKGFRDNIIVKLELFRIGSAVSKSMKYVGLNIDKSADIVTVNQYVYASSI